MTSTHKAAEEFNAQGYVVLRQLFDGEYATRHKEFLEQTIKAEIEPVFEKWGIDMYAADSYAKVDSLLNDENTTLGYEEKQIFLGHFPLNTRLSEKIYPLAKAIGESEVLREVLESQELMMHMPPMLRYVLPGYGHAAVPPHQDLSYNSHLSNFLTAWTPFVPIDQECGGVIVYEGSHGLETDQVAPSIEFDGWLPPVDTAGYTKKQIVEVNPGDVLLLSPTILHESAANISNRVRLSADLRIFPHHATTTKHCLDLENMQIIEPKAA